MSEVVKEIVKNTSNYLGIYNGKKEENKANLNSLKEELMYNKKIVDDGY